MEDLDIQEIWKHVHELERMLGMTDEGLQNRLRNDQSFREGFQVAMEIVALRALRESLGG